MKEQRAKSGGLPHEMHREEQISTGAESRECSLMSFSLANIAIRICLTPMAIGADKSAVHNLSTSIDLTALTKRYCNLLKF
jgi:hypothetical protein